MTKFWIWSDFHFLQDRYAWQEFTPPANFDCVLIAGDFGPSYLKSLHAIRFFIEKQKLTQPVFYVPGNHDFYGVDFDQETAAALAYLREDVPDGHPLKASAKALDRYGFFAFANCVIAGATLWTDYDLFGNQWSAMIAASKGMNDHDQIRFRGRKFTPMDAYQLHLKDLEALDIGTLDQKCIFVTHHVPRREFIRPRYQDDPITPAFASDLSEFQEKMKPHLWVFGHTHSSWDMKLDTCRFICNPKGYRDENPEFKPGLVIDV